jgi:conjugative transfer signal peptidase TraF
MADRCGQPDMNWVVELRRIIARRRRMRRLMAVAALIGCSAGPLAATMWWKPPVLLVWNASASAPIGLYGMRARAPVRRGDMVVAWTPGPARELAANRRYLPANVPLVKRVAAVAGTRICAHGAGIWVNGRRVAVRRSLDTAGRPMPWWSGCRRLRGGEYLLLNGSPLSFDGRYFGMTKSSDILGRADLLWAKLATGSSDG